MSIRPNGATSTDHSDELRVVVGVDGSECSTRALEFAAHEAALRAALLHIVCAYEDTPFTTPWPVVPHELDQNAAATVVDGAFAHAQAAEPAIVSKGEIRYGFPGRVLVSTSENATLLVVGSRGRSAIAGFLLGSISEHCVRHAPVPVTVVH